MPASIKHLTDKKLNLTSLLARWKDGLYYTAAIVKCDKANKRCLVCFEDSSEVWIHNRDVHIQLTLDQLSKDDDIVCCICDDGHSESPNEIILCDVCNQGYHQGCHNPPVDSSKIDESEDTNDHKDWFCATCSYILNQSDRKKLGASAHEGPKQTTPKQATPKQDQPTARQQASNQSKTPVNQALPQQQTASKQPAKVKHTPTISQQKPTAEPKNSIGPVKSNSNQRQQPYYPLSSQVRIAATSSSAALASLTASSALVVGSSAGRSKQDLVNQSNKSSQRQRQVVTNNNETNTPTIKHAVRKSGINFTAPAIRQSALPTATRSPLPTTISPVTKPSPIASAIGPGTIPNIATTSVAGTVMLTSTTSLSPVKIVPVLSKGGLIDGNSAVGDKSVPTLAFNPSIVQPVVTSPQVSLFSKLVNWTSDTSPASTLATASSSTVNTVLSQSSRPSTETKESQAGVQANKNNSNDSAGARLLVGSSDAPSTTTNNNNSTFSTS